MRTHTLRAPLGALALAAATLAAPTLYADNTQFDPDGGSPPTCSAGTSAICRQDTTITTTCSGYENVYSPIAIPFFGINEGNNLLCQGYEDHVKVETWYWSR